MARVKLDVRFGPAAAVSGRSKVSVLFDQLARACTHKRAMSAFGGKAERPGGQTTMNSVEKILLRHRPSLRTANGFRSVPASDGKPLNSPAAQPIDSAACSDSFKLPEIRRANSNRFPSGSSTSSR